MGAWVASGRVLDIILIGMGLEAVALVALWRIWHRGIRPSAVLPNLCSGMCLLVAMRVGLSGAWWGWISLPLLGALLGHVADLRLRWTPAVGRISGAPSAAQCREEADGAPLIRPTRLSQGDGSPTGLA